ncbi:modin [Trichoderma cornu-damae]|uniref:Modin n=1 Tax=Trichoderma cornu-damae TaxID=654480 RepID=A0A9P8QVB1_9HYPO|nr:modin [Trichoderma cornu-damae]
MNSTNSTNSDNSSSSGGGGGSNADFVVAAVALVVSVVALLATFMQVLQQYYASAQGYSQCNEKVMGGWAKSKTRQFRLDELRFEVQFDVPVIFVSPPTNQNGPVADAPIFYLDGTQKSQDDTDTTSKLDLRKEYKEKSAKEKIHTSDNEKAAWYVLLFAAQRMESESREWQKEEYKSFGPPGPNAHMIPPEPPTLKHHHTLAVAVQRKRKSWDTMPISVIKPYATTTMCHLIEMMAAIGVYWKEFDRKRDRYWGEGNGFMILGERLSDLGLMFSFQVNGQCTFKRNRVVPVDEIKELCFGYVPTVYREKDDKRRLKAPSDEQQNLGTLLMGNSREMSETLIGLGCNNNTIRFWLDEGKRTSHLFPISFEILGMLSRIFHIENSNFTFLPNPTPDSWDKRSVSLPKILEAFHRKCQHDAIGMRQSSVVIARYRIHIQHILQHLDDESSLQRWLLLTSLHAALDDTDDVLTARTKSQRQTSHDAEEGSEKPSYDRTAEVEKHMRRREVVQDVLRHHIQEVVRLLNQQEDQNSDALSLHPDMPPPSLKSRPRPPLQRFEDMDAAGPDDRQDIFMDVYFDVIRPYVVSTAAHTTYRRNSLVGAPPGLGRTPAGSIRSNNSPLPHSPARGSIVKGGEHLTMEVVADDSDGQQLEIPIPVGNYAEPEEPHSDVSLADVEVSHDDVWCTLVFRMVCWLMLHNFNKKDVQFPKSELLGSRMPVYIS